MKTQESCSVIHLLIPAAGSGTRAGMALPKQYVCLAGKSILRWTIERFLSISEDIRLDVTVVIDPAHRAFYDETLADLLDHPRLHPPVLGGKTRKESVRCGLEALLRAGVSESDHILVHDAARSFVTPADILAMIDVMRSGAPAVTLCAPVSDTLVCVPNSPVLTGHADEVLDRDHTRAILTPQGSSLGLLMRAHALFETETRFTDDAGLLAAMDVPVTLVMGARTNFKITTPEDFIVAEKILSPSFSPVVYKTGQGFDVHAFELSSTATHVRLGGVDIPHPLRLEGHSDADVVLHALTDALLGAAGEGDIGLLFPPSDPQWKNADSRIFLTEAMSRVRTKGGSLVHADLTIICEAPKIGPHRKAMEEAMAQTLGVSPACINVKATTTEGLGFTGRKEGIAAQAVATLAFPMPEERRL